MSQAERSEDELAIQRLVSRYCMAWDRVDPAGVSATFATDGTFVDPSGTPHCGSSHIEALVEGSPAFAGSMRHITSTHIIEFESDTEARHSCYLIYISHPYGTRRIRTGEYSDHLVRTDAGWRFRRRQVTLDPVPGFS